MGAQHARRRYWHRYLYLVERQLPVVLDVENAVEILELTRDDVGRNESKYLGRNASRLRNSRHVPLRDSGNQ